MLKLWGEFRLQLGASLRARLGCRPGLPMRLKYRDSKVTKMDLDLALKYERY